MSRMKYVIALAALLATTAATCVHAESYAASTNKICQESLVKNTKTLTVGRIEKTCRCATAMILDGLTPAELDGVRTDKMDKVLSAAYNYCVVYGE